MSENDTIWRATNESGSRVAFAKRPQKIHGGTWFGVHWSVSYGEFPPPGECWEMTVTRKGEPSDQQAAIAELQEKVRKLKVESAAQTDAISEREDRIDRLSHDLGLMTRQRDELQAKLERPEMPECVRTMLSYGTGMIGLPGWCELRQQVIAHYAPPLKFEVGGVYIREPYGHDELELLKILDDRMLFYLKSYSEVAWTDSKGQTNGWKIIKRVR